MDSGRALHSDTLPLSEIAFGVNKLFKLLLKTYADFKNKWKHECSLPNFVRVVEMKNCLVRMLCRLVDDVNRADAGAPNGQLIDDYDLCRKMYYKIKKYIAAYHR